MTPIEYMVHDSVASSFDVGDDRLLPIELTSVMFEACK